MSKGSPEQPGQEWLPPQVPGQQSPQGQPPPPQNLPPPPPPPPPPYQQPTPGHGPFTPPQPYPQPHQQQQAHWQPLPPSPGNGDAVAGFTCAVVGAALLFFTAGLSSIISLILGIVAIPYSRKGRRNVEEGKTRRHLDIAKAGYVTAIVTIVLSVLATITWALLFTLVDWDEIDTTDDSPDIIETVVGLAARLILLLA